MPVTLPKTVCADNASVSLTGSVTGGSTTGQWTTSGDGSFGNANSLSTTYTPGANDKSGGSVTLTLTSTNNRTCTPGSDNMVVSIVTVTAAAGDDFHKKLFHQHFRESHW
jgi:hypothetical protein